jgi:D-lactate dehydrogenase
MALIYFYDSTELDKQQLSDALSETDHSWEFVEDKISIDNCNPDAEVVSVFVTSNVTRQVIESMPKLRLIACRSTGFNNIDFDAVKEKGITVVNVPTYGESTVAEYAFTLLLALQRKLPEVLAAENQQFSPQDLNGHDLDGKTLGVVGTGHIGQKSIKIGNGFSMKVIAYDAFPKSDMQNSLGFEYVELDELLERADVVTLHTPYLSTTHHIMNSERLNKMKTGSILVNTARGELVDTKALVEVLESGKLAGAALDVVEGEALLNHHEETALLRSEILPEEVLRHSVEISVLKKMPNVIVSPHNAFNTVEAIQRINNTTAKNISDFWYDNIPNKVEPAKKPIGKLTVVRHAESEWNATGKWTGITDVHLSEKGFRESALLGQSVKNLGIKTDIAFCSEQIRTRETLEGILNASQQFEVDIVPDRALNERDYGDYTGKNKWEIKDLLGEEAFNSIRRGWDVPVPNGETLKMVYERVVPFYLDTILPLLVEGKNVMLVAHGNSIRALMKYIESIPDEEVGNLEMIFGQIVVYELSGEGKKIDSLVARINTTPPKA